jgi:monoamine oxidase
MLQMSPSLRGIRGGMQHLTDAMLERAKLKGVKVYTGHILEAIASAPDNKVTLVFQNGETAVANRVILALPASPLKTLKGLPESIRSLLHSVLEVPLLKSFIVVQKPWWKENIPNVGVTAMPARELHYYRNDDLGCIMLYADRPYINFWSKYVVGHDCHNQVELEGNQDLQRMLAQQMHLDHRDIIAYGIRDWGRVPYGAACHLWRPGIQSWKIIEQLTAFALNSGERPNVHVCGEAFSDYQGFMEGALRTAYQVMTRIQG